MKLRCSFGCGNDLEHGARDLKDGHGNLYLAYTAECYTCCGISAHDKDIIDLQYSSQEEDVRLTKLRALEEDDEVPDAVKVSYMYDYGEVWAGEKR